MPHRLEKLKQYSAEVQASLEATLNFTMKPVPVVTVLSSNHGGRRRERRGEGRGERGEGRGERGEGRGEGRGGLGWSGVRGEQALILITSSNH